MCPLERVTKYKYKFEKSWQKWLSGQHLYTIVSIGIPMEVAARFKHATFKLSCKTQAKRKKYRLTPIAFPHGNEPFNCKQNRFPHPPVVNSHHHRRARVKKPWHMHVHDCPWFMDVYGIDGHPIIGNIGIESPTEILVMYIPHWAISPGCWCRRLHGAMRCAWRPEMALESWTRVVLGTTCNT